MFNTRQEVNRTGLEVSRIRDKLTRVRHWAETRSRWNGVEGQ